MIKGLDKICVCLVWKREDLEGTYIFKTIRLLQGGGEKLLSFLSERPRSSGLGMA